MLRTVIIGSDARQAQQLEKALSALANDVSVSRIVPGYPDEGELIRTLRTNAPDVIFISFEKGDLAVKVVERVNQEVEGVQYIAYHRHCDAATLREVMRAGVREVVSEPFELSALVESLRSVKALVEQKPPTYSTKGRIYSFLPAKAGSGATTLALNLSAALARVANTKVLLSDLDLSSGILRFLLKIRNEHAIMEVLEHMHELDENLWEQLVTTVAKLDVLHSGPLNPNVHVEPAQVHDLAQFWLRNYDVVCVDLSGNLERYSLEILRDSQQVFLVCTPEVPSLHLTREKLAFLKNLELDGRVSVVLNRISKQSLLTPQQVQDVLGVPVMYSFINDYQVVNTATRAGEFVDPKSKLGAQFADLAASLLNRPIVETGSKRKFLEFLSAPTQTLAGSRTVPSSR
ncbi:MAG: AAA family ATPase [Acidobacteriia bacterium]|nr:AAA family ATPase [Terriglobia bacterium]